jgi:glucosamine 6-phosphate synthetase-like amidotransferase/phosphosugar isomerase protein
MCGIVYVSKKEKSAAKNVWKRYQGQKERGTQGFGYVSVDEGHIMEYERATSEEEIEKKMAEDTSKNILFHHRWPTSTDNLAEAAHPIKVDNKELENVYYIVHNGIISNAGVLKKEHEKLGYRYTTEIRKEWITSVKTYFQLEFNDSEALAVELARLIEGKSEKVHCLGDYAFVVLQATRGGKANRVYFGTNGGNPLRVTDDRNIFALTSEGGKGEVEAGILFSYDMRKRTTQKLVADIGAVKVKETGYGYLCEGYGYGADYLDSDDIANLEMERDGLVETMRLKEADAKETMYYDEVEELKAEIADIEQEIYAAECGMESQELFEPTSWKKSTRYAR